MSKWKTSYMGGKIVQYKLHKPGVGSAYVITTSRPDEWYWCVSLNIEGGTTGLTDSPLLSGYGTPEECMDRAEDTLELIDE